MSEHLARLAAEPCTADASPAEPAVLAEGLQALRDWRVEQDCLCKRFAFADFRETIAFVNACAWIAERADHHPELRVDFAVCEVRYSTHSAKAITRNDLICAARIERLVAG